ncbi:hypothetical protein ACJMK2_025023 [Sinanodonta woodiana]|uniref:Uncharacterized protein n=1 Tax=Sinanodonta woodiana TaxID=1069815 RepID=A0ABD3XF88_SINWO
MERIPTFFHTCLKMPNVPKEKKKETPHRQPLNKKAGGVPATGVNPFWNEFANKLNKYCGSSGTGVMCCSRYQKVKNLFPVGVAQEIQRHFLLYKGDTD